MISNIFKIASTFGWPLHLVSFGRDVGDIIQRRTTQSIFIHIDDVALSYPVMRKYGRQLEIYPYAIPDGSIATFKVETKNYARAIWDLSLLGVRLK